MIRNTLLMVVLILTATIVLQTNAQSQSLNDFRALRSYGQIPEDFLNSMRVSIADSKSNPDSSNSRKQARISDKFQVMSDYYMKELLTSGHVVFGDPIGAYVNKVADTLLASYPDLRGQLRFYVTKSVAANAYATDQGIIFINIGLIARVKNEAQLAYILAHEIVHYVKKHNISIFIEKQKAYSRKSGKSEYKDLSVSEKIMKINYRSKEIETLADHDALTRYFSASSYDIEAVEAVFDVLLYSAYPFTNEAFDLSLLETKDMILPDYYLVDDVEKLKVDDNEADSMSTHPNVRKRKEMIRDLVDSIPEYGTRKFIHSQTEFSNVVNLAKFEVLRQLIIDHQLIEALFCAASLNREFPGNVFVKKCIAASLYGISSYKSSGEASDILEPLKEVAGEMGQVNFMVTKLNRRDMNILALNYTFRLHQQIPDDEYLAAISDDLFFKMVKDNDIKESFFYAKSLEELKLDLARAPEVSDTLSGSTRHRKKKSNTSKIDTTFTKFAFVDLMKDPVFTEEFEKWQKKSDSVEAAEKNQYGYHSPFHGKSTNLDKKSAKRINNIVMSEPYTIRVDTRKRDEVKFEESAVNAILLKKLLIKNADVADIKIQIAAADGLEANNVGEYNDMTFINEYVSERFNQSADGMMLSFCQIYVDSVMKKSNTPYLGWMGITSVQKKKPIAKLCILSVFPYLWPYTIYQFVAPKVNSSYYYVLFNVESGKMVVGGGTNTHAGFHRDQMNAYIYDFMYQIKKTYAK